MTTHAPELVLDLTDAALAAPATAPGEVLPSLDLDAAVAAPATAPEEALPSPVGALLTAPVVVRRRVRPTLGRRVLRLLSGLLLAATAIAAVATAALVVTWKMSAAPVLSPSMEPAFGPGDLVITRALDAQRVVIGDVVILPVPDAPGQRYVHRVIEVTREGGLPVVRTQGDASSAPDSWRLRIDSPQVPLVVADVPGAGRLGMLTQGVAVRVVLLVAVAGLALVGVKRALLD